MEEGEGGVTGEVAEPAELDCRIIHGEGGGKGKGGEGCDGGDEGDDDVGWGVGRRHWRWQGEGDRLLVQGGGGGGGWPAERGVAIVGGREGRNFFF